MIARYIAVAGPTGMKLRRRGGETDEGRPDRRHRLRVHAGRYRGHSGIAWPTPANVHYGHSETVIARRADVLTAAYTLNPNGSYASIPNRPPYPTTVWINKPDRNQEPAHSTSP
jgi:hypothetical protein